MSNCNSNLDLSQNCLRHTLGGSLDVCQLIPSVVSMCVMYIYESGGSWNVGETVGGYPGQLLWGMHRESCRADSDKSQPDFCPDCCYTHTWGSSQRRTGSPFHLLEPPPCHMPATPLACWNLHPFSLLSPHCKAASSAGRLKKNLCLPTRMLTRNKLINQLGTGISLTHMGAW